MSRASSVLPGQSPPIALICTPAPIMLSVRMVALRLSAVQVVTISAPRIASSFEPQAIAPIPCPARFGDRLARRRRIDVVIRTVSIPHRALNAERLEFALRAGPDDRHRARTRRREIFGGQRRGRRGAKRGEDRHFGDQHRIAAVDVRQHAEGRHRLAPLAGVLRMAVDVFEAIGRAVAGRHQLDHPFGRMGGDPRRLVEHLPAAEILLDSRPPVSAIIRSTPICQTIRIMWSTLTKGTRLRIPGAGALMQISFAAAAGPVAAAARKSLRGYMGMRRLPNRRPPSTVGSSLSQQSSRLSWRRER